MFDFTILGTRGTTTVCSPEFLRYGGSTTSFSLQTDAGYIIVDAGTGISRAAHEISALDKKVPIALLFTHFHLDHLTGLPSFNPLYDKQSQITIMADPRRKQNWQESLTTLIGKPYWPIGIGEVDARMEMKDLPISQAEMSLNGVTVSWYRVPHPQQCLAYRFSDESKTVIVATDVEYRPGEIDEGFIDFCRDADHLIFDSQYTPEEYQAHAGWGHSTWETAAEIADSAKAGQLILTHHAPGRTDAEIDEITARAKESYTNTVAASDGMKI